jgi:hypothetical protein
VAFCEHGRVVSQAQNPIGDVTHKPTAISRRSLNVGPLLIGHERGPSPGLRLFVRPAEQVDKLGSALFLGFPHCDDVEPVLLHDAGSVIPEARVECVFVRLENLVDAQLLGHFDLAGLPAACGTGANVGVIRYVQRRAPERR